MRREEAEYAVIGPAQVSVFRAGIAFSNDTNIGNLNPAVLLAKPGEPDAVADFGFGWFAVSLLVTVLCCSSVAATAPRVRALPSLVVICVKVVMGVVGLRKSTGAGKANGQTREECVRMALDGHRCRITLPDNIGCGICHSTTYDSVTGLTSGRTASMWQVLSLTELVSGVLSSGAPFDSGLVVALGGPGDNEAALFTATIGNLGAAFLASIRMGWPGGCAARDCPDKAQERHVASRLCRFCRRQDKATTTLFHGERRLLRPIATSGKASGSTTRASPLAATEI
jgi:hypothetical protein